MVDFLSQLTVFGMPLIACHNFGQLFLRLAIDLTFTLVIIRGIFYPIYREPNYLFTTVIINIVVFVICFFLSSIHIGTGFAFGLFAVLSIVRYRTEQIPIRQMTYLFAMIIIAVINALSGKAISLAELLFANTVVATAIYSLEKSMQHHRFTIRTIKWERTDLIRPERYEELLQELRTRTGFPVRKAEVESVNFLNNTVELKIFCK